MFTENNFGTAAVSGYEASADLDVLIAIEFVGFRGTALRSLNHLRLRVLLAQVTLDFVDQPRCIGLSLGVVATEIEL